MKRTFADCYGLGQETAQLERGPGYRTTGPMRVLYVAIHAKSSYVKLSDDIVRRYEVSSAFFGGD